MRFIIRVLKMIIVCFCFLMKTKVIVIKMMIWLENDLGECDSIVIV